MSEGHATVVRAHSLRLELPTKKHVPTVFTVLEVAKILRIGYGSAYLAIARGEVPSVRVGRRILVPRYALEQMLITPVSRLGHLVGSATNRGL
jgi:excisionase family DNA binding protein